MSDVRTYKNRLVKPSKLSDEKVYAYIKRIEVDGIPRVRAYAEIIDPEIYNLPPQSLKKKLDELKEKHPNYDSLKEMVLAEQKDWALRRSSALQDKAMNLLSNLLDKANEIATNPDTDAKELNTAIQTLKTVMPAFTAVSQKANSDTSTIDRKKRAATYIN